jgi:hypothetical protein
LNAKIISILMRVHLIFFFTGFLCIFLYVSYDLAYQPGFVLSMPQVLVAITLVSATSIVLHVGAYDLTMDMVRMSTVSVEKNPISRFLFTHLGYNKTLWGTSIFMAVIIGYAMSSNPTSTNLEACALVFIGLNALDYANDKFATELFGALMKSPSSGVPAPSFLPCPALRPRELTEENIRKIWSKR